ncbi:MAG TPA: hydrolase [Anaerolineae bacterium]|nr:hydrolase [Anaerolineae bacterium]
MNNPGLPPGKLITREESLLVIIDVQEKMMPPIADGQRVLDNVVRLLRFSEILGLPVILTEQNKLGDTLPEVLAARPGLEPIHKWEFGCFGCQEFVDRVRALGLKTLILAGVEAHICVAQTALQGVADYTIHVVSDATSSRTRDNCKVALKRMRQAGVVITSTEMVIYELLQRAGTDEFRAVLPLVK